jgi:replicative DNA helicase
MTELRAIAGGLADIPDPPRIAPHDAHAETALVVTMVLEPSRIAEILALGVRIDHFYGSARTRRVFEAIVAMHDAAENVDLVSVATRLRETGRLAEVGGMAGLTELLGEAVAVSNVAAYARAIRDAWRLRQLLFECQRLIPTIYGTRGSDAEVERGQAYAPAQALLDKVSGRVHELACETSTLTAQSGPEVMAAAHTQMAAQADRAARAPGSISGTTTGLRALDNAVGGLHPGELTLIGGPPGAGKSSLLLTMALAVAALGVGVAFYSLELPTDVLGLRAAFLHARVPFVALRRNELHPSQSAAVVGSMNAIANLPIIWDGLTPKNPAARVATMADLLAKATRATATARIERRPPIGLVLIDYLQKIREHDDRATREQVVTKSAQGAKLLAVRLGVPVVVAAALNSDWEAQHRKPTKRDMRESKGAGYEADNVWLLYRDPKRSRDDPALEIIIDKQRNGPEDTVVVGFDRPTMRFYDLDAGEAGSS